MVAMERLDDVWLPWRDWIYMVAMGSSGNVWLLEEGLQASREEAHWPWCSMKDAH